MAKPKVVLILGSGFSSEGGLPTTREIVDSFLETPSHGRLPHAVEREISKQLRKFWKCAFHYDDRGDRPSLEDHFTVLDLAANIGRNIGPEYTPKKLRAIRRLSIHRIFQILDQPNLGESRAIQGLLDAVHKNSEPEIISTNWDIVVENRLRGMGVPYWYGLPMEDLGGRKMSCDGFRLLMLHGSANWIYCDSCRRLYCGREDDGKAALRALIYIEGDDFRKLCPENRAVVKLVSGIPRQPKKCVHCGTRLGARIATFSYRKEVSIPQFQEIWQRAFDALRESDSWLFIGYSLPEADFEFRHLLKSAEKAQRSDQPKNIRVIVKDDCEAAGRFRRFFGITDQQIHRHGLSGCMRTCIPVWLRSIARSTR
jgi:SIR2-like domain